MNYYDNPLPYPEFTGCPCCMAGEESLRAVENQDGIERRICSKCNVDLDWAYENTDRWELLPDDYFDRTCYVCQKILNWGDISRCWISDHIYGTEYLLCQDHYLPFSRSIQEKLNELTSDIYGDEDPDDELYPVTIGQRDIDKIAKAVLIERVNQTLEKGRN